MIMWKKYSEEKPTNERHEYLVKWKGILGGASYEIYSWANNLSLVDEYDFAGIEKDGFYYLDPEWGFCNIELEDNELYWIDLTEADFEWSKNDV